MAVESPVRSLVLWFPDWPVTALTRDGATPLDAALPIAVMEHNLVTACSASARTEGVRRGQRRRDAQARCPGLKVVPADAARDHRAFAPVVTRIEERAPGVQVVRPGLCALRARGPSRYYGGEAEAARVLLGVLREWGLDGVRAAVADGPFTAEQAAKAATTPGDPVFVVPAGGAAGFLAPLSVAVLEASSLGVGSSLAPGVAPADLVGLLARLGVQTLGDFAAMAPDRVRERFGERGIRLHDFASGSDSRPVEPRTPPPELHREVAFEPPLELADQVAFGMRMAADEFIAGLGAVDLVCTELRVELIGDRGERSERVWLHPGSFDASAVVDRVRWQLAEDGARQQAGGLGRSPIEGARQQAGGVGRSPIEGARQQAGGVGRSPIDGARQQAGGLGRSPIDGARQQAGGLGRSPIGARQQAGGLGRSPIEDLPRQQAGGLGRSPIRNSALGLRSGVALVRISPEAVDAASHHAPAIFGAGPEERVHHALSRVQAMLGHRGVVTPAIGGGRWLAERQVLVPWGDRDARDRNARSRGGLAAERARPWPGSLPEPLPATVFAEPLPVEVTALGGELVDVDERGNVSAVPAMLAEGGRRRAIDAWTGPWPIVERGWDAARARRAHRFQVVDADGSAWLLICEGDSWVVEASYD